MDDAAASEGGVVNFPPGAPAPKAADRLAVLTSPERLTALNAGKAEFYAKPLEERRALIAGRKTERARKAAEREAARAAKRGGRPPDTTPDDAPPTVRSQRSSLVAAPPESEIPRPGVRGGALKGLLDVCEALESLGQGSTFVQVTRLKPTVSFGTPCAGVQRPLWEAIDDAEFSVAYGGGEYMLRGYQLREDGRSKALTEPVTYKVPGNPNLDSALTEEDAMRPQASAHVPNGGGSGGPPRLGRPGVVTPHVATAEAEMFARNLDHQETMDERAAQRATERRRRDEAREAQDRNAQTEAVRLMAEARKDEAERTREIYEAQLASKGGGLAEAAELIRALQPQGRGEDTQALLRQHTAQIQQLTESNKQEMLRLTEQHREEIVRLTTTHGEALRRVEDQARSDRDRADKLVRETEQRANEQIREAERRADGRVTDAQNAARATYDDLRTRSEERLRDQNQQWQQRFDDKGANHDREIRQKEGEMVLMRSNLDGNMQVILAGKDTEIKRLQSDLRKAQDEVEKAKDWVGQMGKFEKQAEALGFQKPEGGAEGESDDLKTTLIKTAMGTVQNLPAIIDSASAAFRGNRNPPAAPDFPGQARAPAARGNTRAMPRAPGAPPPMLAPLPFATEDGGYVAPADSTPPMARRAPPPQYQQQPLPPFEQSPTHAIVQALPEQLPLPLPEQQPQQAPPPPEQQQYQANATTPPSSGMVAAPSVPPPVAPQGGEDSDLDPMTLGIIQGLTPDFAGAFTHRVQPVDVVGRLIQDNGIENVRAALAVVTIDQVLAAIDQDANPQHSVLKTRNGQKFLRAIWAAAEQKVSQ